MAYLYIMYAGNNPGHDTPPDGPKGVHIVTISTPPKNIRGNPQKKLKNPLTVKIDPDIIHSVKSNPNASTTPQPAAQGRGQGVKAMSIVAAYAEQALDAISSNNLIQPDLAATAARVIRNAVRQHGLGNITTREALGIISHPWPV